MPDPSTAVLGGVSLLSGVMQSEAAGEAADIQAQSAERGMEEQRRQFDILTERLRPYFEAGQPALQQQQAFLGLRGPEEQQAAISQLEQSPLFQAQVRQGEEALLQRASATGGLRGGNIQAALAQFRPQMLQQQIANQYANLGGMTELGQRSAVLQGASGMELGKSISDLLGQRGAALAGGQIAQGSALGGAFGNIAGLALSKFGGSPTSAAIPQQINANITSMGGGTGLKMPML